MKKMKYLRTWLVVALVVTIIGSLTGGTVAWFTDSVVSATNTIETGNLDVELEYKLRDSAKWQSVTKDTKLFADNTLWEPGHTEVVALRIKNVGSLALKYDLKVKVNEETPSTNVYDNEFKLSDYLTVGHSAIQQDGVIGDMLLGLLLSSREQAQSFSEIGFDASINNPNPVIAPDEAHVVALAVYMPTTVGNEANHKTGVAAPSISFGIDLQATQAAVEPDSFGTDYDENATYVQLPPAKVAEMPTDEMSNIVMNSFGGFGPIDVPTSLKNNDGSITLDYGLTFEALETVEDLKNRPYGDWHADFVVKSSKAITSNDYDDEDGAPLVLLGHYGDFGWVPVPVAMDVEADKDYRLLASVTDIDNALTYAEVVELVKTFKCGIKADPEWATEGTTITVELKVWETNDAGKEINEYTIFTKSYTY